MKVARMSFSHFTLRYTMEDKFTVGKISIRKSVESLGLLKSMGLEPRSLTEVYAYACERDHAGLACFIR